MFPGMGQPMDSEGNQKKLRLKSLRGVSSLAGGPFASLLGSNPLLAQNANTPSPHWPLPFEVSRRMTGSVSMVACL